MAVSEDEVASWKLEETVEWALKQYNSRAAHRFEATAPAITSHDLTEVQCLKIATAQVSPSCDPSPESQCLNSVKSAEVIVLQAFGVHFLKEVTRQQLVRAINNHLPQNAERKALLTAPKTSLLKPLAQGLLAKKIIQINSGADVCDLTRDDILVSGVL
ncbi:hypothetical protein EMCRGX_G022869 [Ephydatia muelleri]